MAGLPSLAPVVQKAIAVTENPDGSNERLQQVLSADQAATAGVLRLANSAYFGAMQEIQSLSVAINIMGHSSLRTLLRHMLVSELFKMLAARGSAAVHIWEMSVAAGAACREIAEVTKHPHPPDECAVGGLLHNIGELALWSQFPADYESSLQMAESRPKRQARLLIFGVDSSTVARWLLEAWNFPRPLIAAVEFWEQPLQASFSASWRQFAGVVHAGVRLAEAWSLGLPASSACARILPEVQGLLQLRSEAGWAVYQDIPRRMAQIRGILA